MRSAVPAKRFKFNLNAKNKIEIRDDVIDIAARYIVDIRAWRNKYSELKELKEKAKHCIKESRDLDELEDTLALNMLHAMDGNQKLVETFYCKIIFHDQKKFSRYLDNFFNQDGKLDQEFLQVIGDYVDQFLNEHSDTIN